VLSAQDVHDKQFKLVRQSTGYDIDEVDSFLDEVEAAIAQLTAELDAHRARQPGPAQQAGAGAEDAPGRGTPDGEGPPTSAARILELAQRTADEYVAEARQKADSLLAEAQQSASSAVADLEAQRVDLEARVAALRGFEAQARNRLTGYLEGQLRDLQALITPAEDADAGR
jgi:DivIVA domain-containing protein